jgi:protein transport protein SEC61 subunit alpha
MSLSEAFAYVYGGMYGEISEVGSGNALLIVLQLSFAGYLFYDIIH